MPAPYWFFRFMYDRESAAWERRRDQPDQRELIERTAGELANMVAPPGPIADLGCGPGAHALALARRGYDVVGVDGSPRMVKVARTRAARDKVDVTFDVRDVSAPLRFADASLGGVLAILVLQHLPEHCHQESPCDEDAQKNRQDDEDDPEDAGCEIRTQSCTDCQDNVNPERTHQVKDRTQAT